MPRRTRLTIPGTPVHIIQRGNNRGPCFIDADDRVLYLGLLAEKAKADGCAIHAYVLMTNHTHLLLTPRRPESASQMMKHIGETYVHHFNRRHSRTGTLWEGRFRSSLVDTNLYFLRCQRYIDLNPVRASMVTGAAFYPWSSYRFNVGLEPSLFLEPHDCYLTLGASTSEVQRQYRDLVKQGLSHEELQEIRDAANGGDPLGHAEFVKEVERRLQVRATRGKPGRPRKVSPDDNRGLTPV